MFSIHPSEELVSLFNKSPYQGQHPESAKVIFVGLDANYSAKLSAHEFFEQIKEYQRDGVAFWKKYGVHHPFLVDSNPFLRNRDSVTYHRNFSKLKLTADHAHLISFVELIDKPTIGISTGDIDSYMPLFNPDHLKWLDAIFKNENRKMVFLSGSVMKMMQKVSKKFGVFDWLPMKSTDRLVANIGGSQVYKFAHFSSYKIHGDIEEMRKIIFNTCVS